MNLRSHPVAAVYAFFDGCTEPVTCFFSSYTYTPNNVEDRRERLAVPPAALRTLLGHMDHRLHHRCDLAFHSAFRIRSNEGEQLCHLPLIDLAGEWNDLALSRLSAVLRDFDCHEAALYASGRSYHLYGFRQLTATDWYRFMARLLITNAGISAEELVDSHSVGNCLERLAIARHERHVLMQARDLCFSMIGDIVKAPGTRPLVELTKLKMDLDECVDWSTLIRALCLLLLQNPRNTRQIVDSRWVAHRLLAGYSALRWTAHQRQYLSEPRLICRFKTDSDWRAGGCARQMSLAL